MKKYSIKALLSYLLATVILLGMMPITTFAAITEGDGTSANPYRINTAEDFLWFAEQVNGGSNLIDAVLTADIDMSSVCSPENGSWTPINCNYSGTFNGNGHEIKNLYINNPEANYQGLFGNPNRAIIENIGLVDCNITGHDKVGGFVGSSSYAIVQYCYVSGTVSGNDDVGGIYGFFGNSAASNDISAAAVSGKTNVGTICGRLSGGYFENSAGIKNGTLPLFGSQGGTLENVMEFADLSTGEACYFMNGNSSVKPTWYQNIGDNGDAYPMLDSTHAVIYKVGESYSSCTSHISIDGFCATCGMFMPNEYAQDTDGNIVIDTAKRFLWFSYYVNNINKNVSAVLTDNIDLSTVCGENIGNWMPIGAASTRFGGTFDGKGHTVSGLYINTEESCQGLFGYIENGKVMNCFVSGSVTADNAVEYSYIGGLCGYNNDGTISGCGSGCTVTVTGTNNKVGGVCGNNSYGTITDCYNYGTVTVTGDSNKVGGITGNNSSWFSSKIATVKGCYNTGIVSASGNDNKLGGVLGYENSPDYSVVQDNYYITGTATGGINGTAAEGKAEAATEAELQSGKVTYLLNSGVTDGTQGWYQTCGTGTPALSGKTVYAYTNCKSEADYTNNPDLAETAGQHDYVNGICNCCKENQPAVLSDGYYQIGNAGQLMWFSAYVNAGNTSANAMLVNDIELGVFTPIGTNAEYVGKFNGNFHKITFLKLDSGDRNEDGSILNYGLFGGTTTGGEISNLYLDGVIESSVGFDKVGAVAGYAYATKINKVYSTVKIINVKADSMTGGLVGYYGGRDASVLTDCGVNADVTGTFRVGGIIGTGWAGTQFYKITDCYYKGNVISTTSSTSIGSIVGHSGTNSTGYREQVTIKNNFYCQSLPAVGTWESTTAQNVAQMDNNLSVTADDFASGEVTYLLNSGKTDGTQVWYQNIDNGETLDKMPIFNGGTVYKVDIGYSNTNSSGCVESANAEKTTVDMSSRFIVTKLTNNRTLDGIFNTLGGFTATASHSFGTDTSPLYGTGSVISFNADGVKKAEYTLIVMGDIDGDSVCDVLDCFKAEQALNNNVSLSATETLASDYDSNGETSVTDYQSMVNEALGK